jgi:hypothetical protein
MEYTITQEYRSPGNEGRWKWVDFSSWTDLEAAAPSSRARPLAGGVCLFAQFFRLCFNSASNGSISHRSGKFVLHVGQWFTTRPEVIFQRLPSIMKAGFYCTLRNIQYFGNLLQREVVYVIEHDNHPLWQWKVCDRLLHLPGFLSSLGQGLGRLLLAPGQPLGEIVERTRPTVMALHPGIGQIGCDPVQPGFQRPANVDSTCKTI